jgi:hypothetical protein
MMIGLTGGDWEISNMSTRALSHAEAEPDDPYMEGRASAFRQILELVGSRAVNEQGEKIMEDFCHADD